MSNPIDEIFNGTPELTDKKKQELLMEDELRDQNLERLKLEQEEAEPSSTESSQPTQTSSTEDQKQVKEEKPSLLDQAMDPERVRTKAEHLLSIPTGIADFGVGLLNKLPKKNLPGVDNPFHYVDSEGRTKIKPIPRFQSESANAIRDISSVVVPSIYLARVFKGAGLKAHGKVGWSIGNDKFVQWLGNTGVAALGGLVADEIAPVQEKDHNAAAMLKQSFPVTWGWIPDNVATLDSDSPDVKRMKNRNEGVAIGVGADVVIGTAKLLKALRGIKHATSWVPENEKARNFVKGMEKRQKLSPDPVENEVLNSAKQRSDDLDELGQRNLANQIEDPWSEPIFGVHDVYDATESGIRTADKGGIVSAAIDGARIDKNIDTVHGRVGSVFTESAIKNGLEADDAGRTIIKGLAEQLKDTKVGYKASNGRYVSHADAMDVADKYAADLLDMDVSEMKKFFEPMLKEDPDTTAKVLTTEGYMGAFKAIRNYMELFSNLDLARAQGVVSTSLGGQVSDMAEGMRLMDGTSAVERAQEQILDRLQYLMQIKGQTSYARGRALNMLNMWNRMKKGFKPTKDILAEEKNETLRALSRIQQESQMTIDTLRAVKAERPQMLGPLMLAYEVTDGKVSTITKLNHYVRNSTGVIKKAFFDARADMPSAWTQGVWANIYNSVLSAVGTPLRAGLSNTVLMIERPLATFAGAAVSQDWKTLRRAKYMYTIGMGDTLQKAFSHMNQVFKRASRDPSSVGYIMRDDIARANQDQMTLLRSFADAAEEEDLYGPSVMVNQIEALNDLAEHPVMRFSANAMTAFDGFTRSFIANIEARGRAYDAVVGDGGKAIDEKMMSKISNGVYDEMFDENGFITDKAVEYASREIAMNLDHPAVDSLSWFLTRVPALKPFMMFPKTSINLLAFSGSHNPLGLFIDNLNEFKLPFNQMDQVDVEKILSKRGIPIDESMEAAYDTLRAELKGRKAIGTLSVMGAAGLFTADRLRGNGLYDKERQKVRREIGWTPRTYKGWDGKWYSYEGLGALSDWLALTTDVMDNFDTLDEPTLGLFLNKMGHLLAANLTNKSFTAGLEPLNDVLAGNPAALARWGSSFGSSFVPMSGLRNEFSRLLTPQLKEVDQELTQLLYNRNPFLKDTLPDVYDWVDGGRIREPQNFFTRVWNTYSPTMKVSDSLSPEKQFLIDIEYDARPTLTTNGKGVEYTPAERSAVLSQMGKDKIFKDAIRRMMNTKDGKNFREDYKKAQSKGVHYDIDLLNTIHRNLDIALRQALRYAESQIPQYDQIRQKQYINAEIEAATQKGDLNRILNLQPK